MPLYQYECARCGPFRDWRPMSESDRPKRCPACRKNAPRLIGAPHLAMSTKRRRGHAINEQSQHAPRQVSAAELAKLKKLHRHEHGAPRRDKQGRAVHRSRNPWMVGH